MQREAGGSHAMCAHSADHGQGPQYRPQHDAPHHRALRAGKACRGVVGKARGDLAEQPRGTVAAARGGPGSECGAGCGGAEEPGPGYSRGGSRGCAPFPHSALAAAPSARAAARGAGWMAAGSPQPGTDASPQALRARRWGRIPP